MSAIYQTTWENIVHNILGWMKAEKKDDDDGVDDGGKKKVKAKAVGNERANDNTFKCLDVC